MKYLFLKKDVETIRKKIEALEKKIKMHGEEMGKSSHDSAETWHDNAPFEIAVSQIKFLGDRVSDWKELLRNARVVDSPKNNGKVQIGSVVQVIDRGRKESWYKIGGYMVFEEKKKTSGNSKADPFAVSYASPLGTVLLKKKEGDRIEIREMALEIVRIINR